MTYGYADLLKAYSDVGVGPGKIVFLTSDMLHVSDYEERGVSALQEAHYNALRELLGEDGTLVVPTRSMQLCNTQIVYDPVNTPSQGVGVFSEYVRKKPSAVRSFHPFNSYAAVGKRADDLMGKVARHAYGMHTPEARFVENDALCVCTGVDPRISCSNIHHVELMMCVPYRYPKEFMQPVLRDDRVVTEPFYMFVWYRDIGVVCNRNVNLFNRFGGRLRIAKAPLGRSGVQSYSVRDFFNLSCEIFVDDIYTWCDAPPEIRPYRK